MTSEPGKRPSIFERASRVFPVTRDPGTGRRVLYAVPLNQQELPGVSGQGLWRTLYHQNHCFTTGGTQILLNYSEDPAHARSKGPGLFLLDLETGLAFNDFPEGYGVMELSPSRSLVLLARRHPAGGSEACIWDRDARQILSVLPLPKGILWGGHFLADGATALIGCHEGIPYQEKCHSWFQRLSSDGSPEEVLDLDGYFCNHIQRSPTDPTLYSYNRWPTPQRRCEVVLHIRDLRGTFDVELPQRPGVVRPGSIWGGQRDHYLWLPDGHRIASYFSPINSDSRDHFDYGWWVSVMDWRTGEDFSAAYPLDRWAGHFAVSPDSRFLATVGRESFAKVFAIDIEGLRNGWNEKILCDCPPSFVRNDNHGPFHMPFYLPDQSGVVFTAGWAGTQKGVYIVEWPADMR